MASMDIGIDLGTSTIMASDYEGRVIVREPSVVAVDLRTDTILGIGDEVYDMVGKTPSYIQVVRPLADGVISDYKMAEVLMKYLLKKICRNQIVKPRVVICVPSGTTSVESQAVIDSALVAGARKVYLIEEPVAAAIGAGIDITRPNGNLIVDIGGGTCDIAVLSLNGIVCKASTKTAGMRFDEAFVRYARNTYNLLVGEKTAEAVKIQIGSVCDQDEECGCDVKGRDLISGLPKKIPVTRSETLSVFLEPAWDIVHAVQSVLEKTPPELVGDIRTNGILLTGGGGMMRGLDKLMEEGTHVPTKVAENAAECVAVGTAKSFAYLDKLIDGFVDTHAHVH